MNSKIQVRIIRVTGLMDPKIQARVIRVTEHMNSKKQSPRIPRALTL